MHRGPGPDPEWMARQRPLAVKRRAERAQAAQRRADRTAALDRAEASTTDLGWFDNTAPTTPAAPRTDLGWF
ncbi:hypothetical protein AU196_03860 [Mycobacterium sp. IS-1742]|uniref:hypothetical protein n=1 Tax=Mycobacterium sp. IS-1742 TaxID=1772285 RepID=UPI00073FC10D|nr:hypothetical protein [Mycobacterium sp. IS-1742]KUI29477.1 hypothetical protein AU196_03860 [Mycobacterium sp. IS-1742]